MTGGRGTLRFAAVMAGFLMAVLILYREPVIGPAFVPVQVATARVVLALLHLAGLEGQRLGVVLLHPDGFSYQISHGCTGFLPAAFLVAGMLAYPAGNRARIVGALAGVPVVLLLNLARLVHLYLVGVRRPEWFALAHEVIWEGVIAGSVLLLWLGWVVRVERARPGPGTPEPSFRGTPQAAVGT